MAHVGTVATAPTSAESRHALKIYHAALDDLDTPADDIAFLRGVYETERQADFDRANPVAYAARTGAPYHDLTTMTDSHSLSVSVYLLYIFFLLYIFSYSGLILVLTCSLFCPYCHSRCGRLSN